MNRVSQSGISLALPKTVDDEKSFDFQQRPNGLDLLGLGLWSYGVDCADSASLSGLFKKCNTGCGSDYSVSHWARRESYL